MAAGLSFTRVIIVIIVFPIENCFNYIVLDNAGTVYLIKPDNGDSIKTSVDHENFHTH